MAFGEIGVILDDLGAYIGGEARKLTLQITANLIESTPVDTGHAKSNWVPSIDSPHEGVAGSKGGVNYGAQSAGIAAVMGYGFLSRLWRRKLFVTNNVPYIGKLNEGYSKQAPAMFVEQAIARAIHEVNSDIGVRVVNPR